MNPEHLQQIIDTFPVEQYPGLQTIGVSRKQTAGEVTDRISIVFGVTEKKPTDQIPVEQLLPVMIEHQGHMVETDVTQDDMTWEFENTCPHTTQSQKNMHRVSTRPLVGGVSMSNGEHDHRYKVGTLGMLVVDQLDGQIVGLTNNHVLTPDVFASATGQTTADQYNFQDVSVFQPGLGETSGVKYSEHEIGSVKRVVPLRTTNLISLANEVDCGVFNISSDMSLDLEVSAGMLGLTHDDQTPVSMIPVATDLEIDRLLIDNTPLFKSSRTTGVLGGNAPANEADARSQCPIQVDMMNYTPLVSGRRFKNVMRYSDPTSSPKVRPSAGGDSGGVICAWIDSQWKAVGLHFAGTKRGGVYYGVMCRMDRVMDELQVASITDDTEWLHGSTRAKYRVVHGYKDHMYVQIDGETYWQVGRTSQLANTSSTGSDQEYDSLE